MTTKNVCYYLKTVNQNNQTVFRCLYDGRYDIAEVKSLDIKNCRNFRMNDKYEATDDDIIQFREDFLRFNEELKKPYFKNKDKTVFKVDMLNYNSTNDAVLNNVLMNSDQERINKIPGIDRREFMMLENCLSCGLMYNYNMVHYEKTVELKTLMRGYFNVMDTLLKQCSKSNWLVKSLMSQSW